MKTRTWNPNPALLLPAALCGCMASGMHEPDPAPDAGLAPAGAPVFGEGAWRVAGASRALFSSTDAGDLGDSDSTELLLSAGRMLSGNLMLEGVGLASSSSFEDPSGTDRDIDTTALGLGVRYYLDAQSATRPYVSAAGGFARLDIDDDFSGIDDSDTAPFVRAGAGFEHFLSEAVAIDLGLFLQRIEDLQIENFDNDLDTYGIAIGLSVWL